MSFNSPSILASVATAVPIPPLDIRNVKSFYHIYTIEYRCFCCCYKPYFEIKKDLESGNWVISREGDDKSFCIPLDKEINKLNDILLMIGLENKVMKMKLIQDGRCIRSKIFFNLNSLFNFIIFTEDSLKGVLYVNK